MHINTAVGEIRTHYLNLPKDDLTEGGRFTAEVLEKLVADERAKVLSEVERLESIKMYKIVGGNPLELLKKSDVLTIINGKDTNE